jgi:hypothetical protein
MFSIVVSNFNPNVTIQVEASGGNVHNTFHFLLSKTTYASTGSSLADWLSGSSNRLQEWLGPQASEPGIETTGGPTYFESLYGSVDEYFPALSRDGTLEWTRPFPQPAHSRPHVATVVDGCELE